MVNNGNCEIHIRIQRHAIQGHVIFFFFSFSILKGDGEDNVGSHFLTGCLKKIQVQGKDLDLDSAAMRKSVSSHSCPA